MKSTSRRFGPAPREMQMPRRTPTQQTLHCLHKIPKRHQKKKFLAGHVRQEAIDELDQLNKTRPSEEEDEEVRHIWDEKHNLTFMKLLVA